MPVLLLFMLLPTGIAFIVAFESTGKKQWLAWGNFALLVLPVLIAGVGGMLLLAYDLAWRSCVKLTCGFAFVAGVLLLLLRVGIFLWRQLTDWGQAVQVAGRIFILLAGGLFCLVIGWYGVLFSAIWAGDDRVVERNGQTYVEEHVWMDSDFYEYSQYCGPFVRGSKILHME